MNLSEAINKSRFSQAGVKVLKSPRLIVYDDSPEFSGLYEQTTSKRGYAHLRNILHEKFERLFGVDVYTFTGWETYMSKAVEPDDIKYAKLVLDTMRNSPWLVQSGRIFKIACQLSDYIDELEKKLEVKEYGDV